MIPFLFAWNRILFAKALGDGAPGNHGSGAVAKGKYVTLTATVKSKAYDENGNLKTFTAGPALCRCSEYVGPEPVVGSTVTIKGKYGSFDRAFNKGGFDSFAYYKARGMDYSIKVLDITEKKPAPFLLHERLNSLRVYLISCVRKYCPRESGTINTLLLADKSGLSPERKNLYQSVSLAHFLVVSGLHVSAFAGAVFRLAKAILRRKTPACILTIILLFLYGMLIDFGVSVARAIIMYTVRLVASILGESYDMLSAASFAAILTLLVNPLWLTDSAFIYSYTAVFGIGFMNEAGILTGLSGVKEKLKDAVKFSFAMCLIMLPVTLKFSGAYTLGAILLNLCIVPFGPLMLGDGFFALAASSLGLERLAGFFDLIEYGLLKITDLLALSVLKFGALRLSGEPHFIVILIYYAALLFYAFKGRKCMGRLSGALIITCIMQAVSAIWWWTPAVSMLYVGQGECIVVRTGPRTAFVSDCGSTSKSEVWNYDLEPFLNASGIKRIEGFFLSHSDKDHSSGIIECLESYKRNGIAVDALILQRLGTVDPKLEDLKALAGGNGIPVHEVAKGDRASFGDWKLNFLWPAPERSLGDVNSDSLTFRAEYGEFSMLFTGDISEETEGRLILNRLSADILKSPHHGSKSASSEVFLRAVNPKATIISAGIDNRYHHPSPEVTDRLKDLNIPFFCTADCGEIDVIISGNPTRFTIKKFRNIFISKVSKYHKPLYR